MEVSHFFIFPGYNTSTQIITNTKISWVVHHTTPRTIPHPPNNFKISHFETDITI